MPKRSLQKADPATGSKKQKPAKAEISSSSEEQRKPDKGKELQALGDELKGLYTSNAVTARKAASVFKKAHNAGLRLNTPFDKTFSLREAAEASAFKPAEGSEPELCWATIPLKSGKTKEVKHEKMPFLLPHEWLADYFLQPGAVEEALPPPGSPLGQELLRVEAACRSTYSSSPSLPEAASGQLWLA